MSDVSATLAERGGRYGAFADHAKIAQGLQGVLFEAPNWSKLDPDMRQALCVICDKMARILNGDPYYDDNWHDIQGYAKLVETRIRELAATPEPEPIVYMPTIFPEENLTSGGNWGPPEDKANSDAYNVGEYRG
jgi:hypothetical protein